MLEEKTISYKLRRAKIKELIFPDAFQIEEKKALVIIPQTGDKKQIEEILHKKGIEPTIISERFTIFSKRYRQLKSEIKDKGLQLSIIFEKPETLTMLAFPFLMNIPVRVGINVAPCGHLCNVYLFTDDLEKGLSTILA